MSSLALIGIDLAYPQTEIYETVIKTITQIDFYDTVMNGMLAFLLFAGALHVNFARLRKRAASVAILASLGVFITMAIVAFGFWSAQRDRRSHRSCVVFRVRRHRRPDRSGCGARHAESARHAARARR